MAVFKTFFGYCKIFANLTQEDPNMKKIDEYLSVKRAAQFLGVTPNTLRNWEKCDKLKTHRNPANHYRLYCREDLEKLLEKIDESQKGMQQ